MNSYIETAADYAFTVFLQMIHPADLSDTEYRLFRYYRIAALGE